MWWLNYLWVPVHGKIFTGPKTFSAFLLFFFFLKLLRKVLKLFAISNQYQNHKIGTNTSTNRNTNSNQSLQSMEIQKHWQNSQKVDPDQASEISK